MKKLLALLLAALMLLTCVSALAEADEETVLWVKNTLMEYNLVLKRLDSDDLNI